jgi:hypothetical protein
MMAWRLVFLQHQGGDDVAAIEQFSPVSSPFLLWIDLTTTKD